jgi:hypothetical protein
VKKYKLKMSYRQIQAFNKKRTVKGEGVPHIAHQSHLHQRKGSTSHHRVVMLPPHSESNEIAGWAESQITDFNSNVIEYTIGNAANAAAVHNNEGGVVPPSSQGSVIVVVGGGQGKMVVSGG